MAGGNACLNQQSACPSPHHLIIIVNIHGEEQHPGSTTAATRCCSEFGVTPRDGASDLRGSAVITCKQGTTKFLETERMANRRGDRSNLGFWRPPTPDRWEQPRRLPLCNSDVSSAAPPPNDERIGSSARLHFIRLINSLLSVPRLLFFMSRLHGTLPVSLGLPPISQISIDIALS